MKKLFSIFAALLFAGSIMAASITVAHNSSSTTNLDGTNQAASFSASGTALDATVWSFVGEKNDASNNVGLNKDGTIRLYCSNANSGTNGSALVVTLTGGTIQSVSVNVKSGTTLQVLVGGSSVTADGDLYAVNATSFSLQNVAAKGGAQVQINSITINYKMDSDVDVDATAVALNKTEMALEQYREETLVATLTPSNATTVVVWSSSDPTVATVSGGLVKALTLGTTTITATAGEGITASCTVTVGKATVLTCAEAGEKAATLANNNDVYEGGQYVVEGYAISMNTATGYIWIADDKDASKGTFEIYLPSNKSEIASVVKGDKIRAHGYISKYNTTYEFLAGCVFEVIADVPAPSIEASKTTIDFGTVEVGAKGPDDNAYLQETFTLTGTNLTGDVRIEATTTGGGSIFTTNGYRAVATLSPTDGAINSTIYAIAATGFAGTFNGLLTISSDAGDFENFTVALSIVVVEPTKYYLKNNWGGGDWTWKEMTMIGADQYKLNNVVFGGNGVNFNTAESDEGSTWVAMGDFTGDIVKALDTVNFDLTPSTGVVYVQVIGSYVAPADPTWTVAGSSAVAFGTTWAADNADNDMVKQSDGTFLWERTGLVLAAGSVNFKVCRDHAWTVAYPSSDYSLAISADGIYTITITFDPSTNTVSATATKTGDAVVTPVIELKGSWNAAGAYDATWNGGAAYTFVESGAVATYTVNFTETGTYELGLQVNGAWTANGATITRTAPGTDLDNGGTGNMHLEVDVVGEYEFIWTYAVNNLTVMFPDEPVVGCDWDNLEWLGDGSAEQTFGSQFKVCKAGEQPNVVNIQTAPWANNNTGIYVNFPDAVIGNISLPDGQYKIEGAGILLFLSAFTAVETEVTVEWQNGVYTFTVYNAKGVATGIENNAVVEKAVKFIENGQLFIIKNGVKYNAQGAVVR